MTLLFSDMEEESTPVRFPPRVDDPPGEEPSGKRVALKDGAYYDGEGEKMRHRVTTLVESSFPAFDAKTAAARCAGKRKYRGMTPQEVEQLWKNKGSEASSRGTALHAAIERALLGESLEHARSGVHSEREWSQVLDFFSRLSPRLRTFRTEWAICDPQHSVAGTVDYVSQNEDGSLDLYDWKRSDKVDPGAFSWGQVGTRPQTVSLPDTKYSKYSLQLSFYAAILEKNYGARVRSCWIVQFHPDIRGYRLHKALDLRREALEIMRSLE